MDVDGGFAWWMVIGVGLNDGSVGFVAGVDPRKLNTLTLRGFSLNGDSCLLNLEPIDPIALVCQPEQRATPLAKERYAPIKTKNKLYNNIKVVNCPHDKQSFDDATKNPIITNNHCIRSLSQLNTKSKNNLLNDNHCYVDPGLQ